MLDDTPVIDISLAYLDFFRIFVSVICHVLSCKVAKGHGMGKSITETATDANRAKLTPLT
jgi:hypothetical protein